MRNSTVNKPAAFASCTAPGIALAVLLLAEPAVALAQSGLPAFTSTPAPGGGQNYTISLQTLLLLTALTFLPAALLMMTGFTRIIIVLSLLRQAIGTQNNLKHAAVPRCAAFCGSGSHGMGRQAGKAKKKGTGSQKG